MHLKRFIRLEEQRAVCQMRNLLNYNLSNFFPSVNPWLVYRLMNEKMPLHYNLEDQETYKTILTYTCVGAYEGNEAHH